MSFASSRETPASTFVDQSSDDKARYNACFRCSQQSQIITFRRIGLSLSVPEKLLLCGRF